MANKRRKQLQGALQGLGLGGEYSSLIDKSIREGWDVQEFLVALVKHPRFRHQFPGLITQGAINDFLAGGRQGISAANLGRAITQYNQLRESYQQVAATYGLDWFKITPARMKALIKGEKSPDELGRELLVLDTIRKNPELVDQFNAARKAAGLKALDPKEFWKILKNRDQREFFDVYEAARIGLAGIAQSPKEALKLAQGVGQPGQLTDVDAIAREVINDWAYYGPEAERQGLTRGDVFSYLGNPGADEKGIGRMLQQLQANRQAAGRRQTGTFAHRGPGGGLALYEQGQSQSY